MGNARSGTRAWRFRCYRIDRIDHINLSQDGYEEDGMKLFGQFLIDEKLITKEDFVAAMIIRAEVLPSLPLAVHELKLFSIDVQVDIFAYQATHFKEYRSACVEMGIWDEANVDHPLGRFFLSRLKPLGEILVEQGLITLKQLAVVLERYVALEDQIYSPDPAKPTPSITLVKKSDQSFSDVHVKKHNVRNPADSERRLYNLYCLTVNEGFVLRLKAYFNDPSDALKMRIVRDLRAATHSATFINAFKSHELLTILMNLSSIPKTFDGSDKGLVEQGINLIWVLREGLRQGSLELTTLGSNALDSRVSELCYILSKMSEQP